MRIRAGFIASIFAGACLSCCCSESIVSPTPDSSVPGGSAMTEGRWKEVRSRKSFSRASGLHLRWGGRSLFHSSPLSEFVVLPCKMLSASENDVSESLSATFPQCGQVDRVRWRTLAFVLRSPLPVTKNTKVFALLLTSITGGIVSFLIVVSQFSIWSRLRVARAGGQWRLSDHAHGLESFRSNCLQEVNDHNAGIELCTCDTGVCQLVVPHCLWEKSHDTSASK